MKQVLSATLVGLFGALALQATPASAAVVCNEDGDCWKVREQHEYKPEFRVRVYDDNWKWKDEDRGRYRWRDSGHGRGYYRGGVWIGF